jgi:nucleoside-diphosphate-sugar epimerase
MKVIVTGATGRVGSQLVLHCIENSAITSVFVITRKPLPESTTSNNKVTVILHEDFSSWPPELLDKLSGAEGCLW